MKVISRSEAMAQGLPRYFTNTPCKHGHVAERRMSDGCVECSDKHARAWQAANPEKVKAIAAAWAKANPEKVTAKRIAWRAANPERYRANATAWARKRALVASAPDLC